MPEPATPQIVDRAAWERARAELLVREKAHSRAGDALAAARRRLPMTRMEPVSVVCAGGPASRRVPPNASDSEVRSTQGRPVNLLDVFEGRRQLIVYHFMWRAGARFERQCPGCTHTQVAMNDAVRAYLAERDVGYAVFCAGPWAEIAAYRDFMGWTAPWYSTAGSGAALATRDGGDLRCYLRVGEDVFQTYWTTQRGVEAMLPTLQLLDLSVYGRQETWEDSPQGWPQPDQAGHWWWRDGRPVAQLIRTQGDAGAA